MTNIGTAEENSVQGPEKFKEIWSEEMLSNGNKDHCFPSAPTVSEKIKFILNTVTWPKTYFSKHFKINFTLTISFLYGQSWSKWKYVIVPIYVKMPRGQWFAQSPSQSVPEPRPELTSECTAPSSISVTQSPIQSPDNSETHKNDRPALGQTK